MVTIRISLVTSAFLVFVVAWGANAARNYIVSNLKKRKHGCLDSPSYPHSDPIWGIDLFFKTMQAFQGGSYLETHTSYFQQFSSKAFKCNSFGTAVYKTRDAELSKNFQAVYFKNFGVEPLRLRVAENLWGNGIVVSDGEHWAESRRLIRSSFDVVHTANLGRLGVHVERLMSLLPRDGSTVDLLPLFKRLNLDTASEFIFGKAFGALEDPSCDFMDKFEYAQRGTGIRAMLGRLRFLHRDKKWFDACKQVTDFCENAVDEAISRNKSTDSRKTEDKTLRLVDEAAKTTNDRYILRSLVLSVFSPAHDGTAVTLANMFFHLARHPHVWARLQEEVMESEDKPLTYDLLNSYQYLRNVLRETQRLTPSVVMNQRVCLTDTILPCGGGAEGKAALYVRKGDIIEVDYRTMMRDKDFWGADADTFEPARWEEIRPTWEYTPFGGGPRMCPGLRLVFTEAAYTAVTMLRAFSHIENRDPEPAWQEQMRLSFQSKNGAKVGLIPRKK